MALIHIALKKRTLHFLQRTRYCLLVTVILMFFSSAVPAVETSNSISILSVDSGLVTVSATNVPLDNLLQRIGQAANVETVFQGSLASSLSVSYTNIPLHEVFRRLTKGYSTAIIYNPGDAELKSGQGYEITKFFVYLQDTTVYNNNHFMQDKTVTSNPSAELPLLSEPDAEEGTGSSTAQLPPVQAEENNGELEYWSHILQQNPDPELLETAIANLAKIGSDEALSIMASVLGNEKATVRLLIVENIGHLTENNLATQLLGQVLFSDPDHRVRGQAIQLLKEQNDKISLDFLTAAAQKQNKPLGVFIEDSGGAIDFSKRKN